MKNTPCLIHADVLDFCRDYDGPLMHAALLDPPYHLTSISTRYKTISARDERVKRADPYRRTGAGFMGKSWDGGDIAFRPETWEAIASVLHPGAFIIAFAGTRGYHRMAVAAEDAGLIVHPCLGYCFGSGFPKATRIDTQIDAAVGQMQVSTGKNKRAGKERAVNGAFRGNHEETAPATHAARTWQHHRYGLQAIKPAFEVIGVFQKPYTGKPVECITTTGAGSWNIGKGRVGTSDSLKAGGCLRRNSGDERNGKALGMFQDGTPNLYQQNASGRWPANLLLESGYIAEELDRQSGVLTSGKPTGTRNAQTGFSTGITPGAMALTGYGDAGGCSRFFFRSNWHAEIEERLRMEFPCRYVAKAGRRERSAGCEALPQKCIKQDRREEVLKTNELTARLPTAPQGNHHPTVKPLSLSRYLASLLLPPDEHAPRRLFNPFCGSGSESIGAMLAGWEDVVGVEREQEYIEIARARAQFWSNNVGLFESLTAEDESEEDAQGNLFEEGEE